MLNNKVFPVGFESMLKQIENVWFGEFPSEKFQKEIQCECLIKGIFSCNFFSNICKQGLEILRSTNKYIRKTLD